MGFWSSLGKGLLGAVPVVGPALSAMSQGQASNRGTQFEGQLDLERLLMDRDQQFMGQQIAREQEGRASGQDAWTRLLAAQHTLNPGPRPQLSKYSVAPRMAGDAERMGADAMTQEVMARLQGGNSLPQVTQRPMNVDPKLLKSGWLEKLLGIGGAGAIAYGAATKPSVAPHG